MRKKLKRIRWKNVTIAIVIIIAGTTLANKTISQPHREQIIDDIEEITANVINTVAQPLKPRDESKNNELELCSTSKVKTYMEYKMITSKSSDQYIYIQEHMKVNEKGLLVDKEGYIGIALGSYFGDIGTKYLITLSNGQTIKAVKIEAKADEHTNNGCEQRWDKSVIEFVIDTDIAKGYYGVETNGYIAHGNFNNIEEFKGNIQRMEVEYE